MKNEDIKRHQEALKKKNKLLFEEIEAEGLIETCGKCGAFRGSLISTPHSDGSGVTQYRCTLCGFSWTKSQ